MGIQVDRKRGCCCGCNGEPDIPVQGCEIKGRMPTDYDQIVIDKCAGGSENVACAKACNLGSVFDNTPATVGESVACIGPMPGNGDSPGTIGNCREALTPCLADVLNGHRPFCGKNCWQMVCENHCEAASACVDLDGNPFTFDVVRSLSGTGTFTFGSLMDQEIVITLNYNNEHSAYYFPPQSNLKEGTLRTPNRYDINYVTVWMRRQSCISLNKIIPLEPEQVIFPPNGDNLVNPPPLTCVEELSGRVHIPKFARTNHKLCGNGWFHDNQQPFNGYDSACLGSFLGDGDKEENCSTVNTLTSPKNSSPCLSTILNQNNFLCDQGCWSLACVSENGNISGDCGDGLFYQAYNTDNYLGNGHYAFNREVNEKLILTMHLENGEWAAYYFASNAQLRQGSFRSFDSPRKTVYSAVWRRNDAACEVPQPL
jgi:hypothetical protein